jgi:two-component system sensor kinase FixL
MSSDMVDALRQISAQALRAGEIIRRLRELVRNRQVREELLDLNAVVRELAVLVESDARVNNVRSRSTWPRPCRRCWATRSSCSR